MDDREREFELFLAEYGRLLRHAISSLGPDRQGLDADDIEQEVRIRIWKLLDSESNVAHPKSYLYRMAVNATLDAVKKHSRRREDSLAEPAVTSQVEGAERLAPVVPRPASPERTTEHRQLLEVAERCLGRLNANRQTAVRLYLQGFTTQETADLNGWTEAKARNLTYRGLAQLREHLHREGVDDAAAE